MNPQASGPEPGNIPEPQTPIPPVPQNPVEQAPANAPQPIGSAGTPVIAPTVPPQTQSNPQSPPPVNVPPAAGPNQPPVVTSTMVSGSFDNNNGNQQKGIQFGVPTKNKIPLIIGVVVAIVLLGGGAAFFLLFNRGPANCGTVTYTATNSQDPPDIDECFNKHFANCTPAKVTIQDDKKTSITNVAIQGKQESSCAIEIKIVQGVFTVQNGKSMVCPYDNSKSFTEASKEASSNISSCKGSLVDSLKNN